MDAFSIYPHVIALTAAYGLALPIGWERERSDRSAGLRTFPLVAIATCGFIQATENVVGAQGQGQIIGGLITGVGFIGGGAILQRGKHVHGTATAASLWATGANGTSVGLGSTTPPSSSLSSLSSPCGYLRPSKITGTRARTTKGEANDAVSPSSPESICQEPSFEREPSMILRWSGDDVRSP